jgi:hypothetical protein
MSTDAVPALITIPFFANMFRLMWRGLRLNRDFLAYIRLRYPERFRALSQADAAFRDFWGRDGLTHFLVFSREDWDDEQIAAYRRLGRRYVKIWCMTGVGACLAFAASALLLEAMR